jgi:hypothetical protein
VTSLSPVLSLISPSKEELPGELVVRQAHHERVYHDRPQFADAAPEKTMEERDRVIEAAERIANAIGRRDLPAIRDLLAQGFVQRTAGGEGVGADAFLRAIGEIPGDITFVKLERLEIDMAESGALVTGIQHAQVRIDGKIIDDRRAFVDWFVKDTGAWRIRAAVDLPEPGAADGS